MLHGHGDDGYLQGKTIAADFSTNVYSGGAPAGLKEYLFEQWDKVMRYPEVLAESLSTKIAAHYELTDGHILVTSGSTESIYLIAQAFKYKRSAVVIPSFSEYEDACRMYDHELNFISWEKLHEGVEPNTDLLFICNPNNPTGAVFPDLEQLIRTHPKTLFVVDEAFIEFTFAATSLTPLVAQYDNLLIMRSMTKAYAVPGLRLGYIVAPPALINLLLAVKLPWTVNTMALEAGHFIFDHYHQLHLPLEKILSAKKEFVEALSGSCLLVHHGDTHFFLAETRQGSGAELKKFLLNEFSLLIRDAGNFRGLTKNFVRIATLDPAKNQMLINALSEWKPI